MLDTKIKPVLYFGSNTHVVAASGNNYGGNGDVYLAQIDAPTPLEQNERYKELKQKIEKRWAYFQKYVRPRRDDSRHKNEMISWLIEISEICRSYGVDKKAHGYFMDANTLIYGGTNSLGQYFKVIDIIDPFYPEMHLQLAEAYYRQGLNDYTERECKIVDHDLLYITNSNGEMRKKISGYNSRLNIILGEIHISKGISSPQFRREAQNYFSNAKRYLKENYDVHLWIRAQIGLGEATGDVKYFESVFGGRPAAQIIAECRHKQGTDVSQCGKKDSSFIEHVSNCEFQKVYNTGLSDLGLKPNKEHETSCREAQQRQLGINIDLLIKNGIRMANLLSRVKDGSTAFNSAYPILSDILKISTLKDKKYLHAETLFEQGNLLLRISKKDEAKNKFKEALKLVSGIPQGSWLESAIRQKLQKLSGDK